LGLASRFQQLLSAEFLHQALSQAGVKSNNSVYSPLVVLWLLVAQRLQFGASMEAAVLELLHGLPASFWPRPCKRILDWRGQGKAPSSHTGAYNQARQALPLSVVQKSCDHIFQQLVAQVGQPASHNTIPTFLLDGSTMRVPHTPELCRAYPPSSNQYGEAHWPLLRVVVAHDLHTGLAMRPEWGPMNGDQAVSEQALLERAIERLPQRYATLVGERGVKLSGGERQRVALARAFLANAPILILDEATSSLDSESEALIQDAMHSLMKGRTTLVIAHRLSTVRELDRILVFDHGRIVEDGNHAALLRLKGGIYRRLVERQAEGMADDLAA